MTDDKTVGTPSSDHDEPLAGNVERLLRRASAGPRLAPEAKDRILGHLLEVQAKRAAKAPTALPARKLRWRGAATVAGALAIAAGAMLWYTRDEQPVESRVAYENPGPGPREVALRDGTRVTLDVGAKLVERAPRDVELVAGQVVFDVSANPTRFAVATTGGTASALGTRFWMRTEGEQTTVAVAKGRVEIANKKGEKQAVAAGEQGALRGSEPPKAEVARRVSSLFDFARPAEAPEQPGATKKRGTLTARDPRWGKEEPLEVRAFTVDVVVEDGFARTTIDQTYFNPRSRQLEGVYAFPMPNGAALSRLAMYVDGKRMEGAMVDRTRGRDIYEGIVEARRDPALLEWMSGNTFRMRIFPLPARTDKRIFMSYTQPLEHLYETDRLVVPIPTTEQAAAHASFSVKVVGGASKAIHSPSHDVAQRDEGADTIVTFEADQYQLGKDLVLTMSDETPAADEARQFVEGDQRYVLARHTPDLRALASSSAGRTEGHAMGEREARRIAILFDVSASRSEEDLLAQARFVDGLLDSLDTGDEISILTVGYDAEVMPGGPVVASKVDRDKVAAFLHSKDVGIGNTRLDVAFAAAARELERGSGPREVIYVGDGVEVGFGAEAAPKGGRAKALAAALGAGTRFVGVALGDSIDRGLLDAIAEETDGFATAVGEGEDLQHRAFDLVASTYTPCLSHLDVDVLDASGRKVEGAIAVPAARRVCDGERVEVFGRSLASRDAASVRVRGTLGSIPWEKEISLASGRSGASYLPRLFAERRVATLLAEEPPGPGRAESPNAAEITALAQKYFLVTPFTSLLVLENDAMYKQFGVEKKKPSGWAVYDAPETVEVHYEPLGIGSGVAQQSWDTLERSPTELFYDNPVARNTRVRMGGLSTRGDGTGTGEGFGSGRGRLGGAHKYKGDVAKTADLQSDVVLARRVSQNMGLLAPDAAAPASAVPESRGDRPMARDEISVPAIAGGKGWLDDAAFGAQFRAFGYASDPNLQDLTEFAPAMFQLDVDDIGDWLSLTTSSRVDEAARELFARGASRVPEDRFATADGSWAGREGSVLRVHRRLPTGLVEDATLDGTSLTHGYEELGLRTQRTVKGAALWWALVEAPWMIPSLGSFDGLVVESIGDRAVRVRAAERPSQWESLPDIELVFAQDGRVAKVAFVHGRVRRELSISYGATSIVVTDTLGSTRTFTRVPAGTSSTVSDWIDVEIPLSHPRRWDEVLSVASSPRSEVIRARRQLLATYAALHDVSSLVTQLRALEHDAGSLSKGELVLASRALVRAELKETIRAVPGKDPVLDYLVASSATDESSGGAMAKLGEKNAGSLIGFLGVYRSILSDADREAGAKGIVRKTKWLGDHYPSATFFRYVAARRASDRLRWRDDASALALWDELSKDPEIGFLADRHAVEIMRNDGTRSKEAGDRAARSLQAAIDKGRVFRLDWTMRYAIIQSRGQTGFDILMSRWRSAVATGGTARQVLALSSTLLDPYGGGNAVPADMGALLRRFDSAADADDATRIQLVRLLVGNLKLAEAKLMLAPLVNRPEPPAEALELAAFTAEKGGDLELAASLLDRLLVATASEPLDLAVVRGWYSQLVELHLRIAGLKSGAAADAAVKDAIAVASRWRREDADNADIDELCANGLFRMGRMDEGLRHLYSIVERRPAEGSSWGRVGKALERQGDLPAAMLALRQAVRVEPTNPTWLLALAETLLARGTAADETEARAALKQIVDSKWQDRFGGVVNEAQSVLAAPPTTHP